MNRRSKLLYRSRITKVQFSLPGSDSNIRDSHAAIESHDLFRNNLPINGGVYDAHLGTTSHEYKCATCDNKKRNCLGHDGHHTLNYPVISPMAVNEVRKWLKLICFNCGHAIIPAEQYMRFTRSKRLDEASKIARSANRKCVHCKETHPIIKKDPQQSLVMTAEFFEEKRQTHKFIVYPHIIKQVLDRVSDETVIRLGKSIESHPRNFVLNVIKIPATTIRPDVKKIGGGRSTNDDITTMLQIIIKRNETIPSVIPTVIDLKLEKAIYELNNAYNDLIRAGGDGSMNSFATRLRGKQGRFRKTQMGKRVRNMCRSTITGDVTLRIDEVGVPLIFARTIQYEEVVQEYNKKRLMVYVNNGRERYPGCTEIVKRSTGKKYGVESLKDFELENGDTIYRDMITGDPVNFNRQPSLRVSNISTMRAVVSEDPSMLTLRMNVIACKLNQRA